MLARSWFLVRVVVSLSSSFLRLAPVSFAAAIVGLAAHSSWAQVPPHQWSQRFGNAVNQGVGSVTADADGNVVVTGYIKGTVNFGGGPLVSAGNEDIFVAKFASGGAHIWSKRFGDAEPQGGGQVVVDASGNVFVAGSFGGNVNFGGGNLASSGAYDAFVAKFTPGGAHRWSRRFGDAAFQRAGAVAVGGSGSVVIAGQLDGEADFGGGLLTGAGLGDAFIASFDSVGTHLWSQSFGDSTEQSAVAVTVDASGNVIVTGTASGTVDFGGGPLTGAGGNEIYAAKFTAGGAHVWSKLFGGLAFTSGPARTIGIDGSDNIILGGGFIGSLNFGGGPITSAGTADAFLAKLTSGGAHVWSQRFGDAANHQYVGAVAVGQTSGNILVTGFFGGSVDFGGEPLTSSGNYDILLAMFTPGGVHLWSERYGDGAYQYGFSAAMDASENAVVCGTFEGTVDFGGGPLTATGSDLFVAKFAATPTGVETGREPLPSLSAYPNPFNPGTTISYVIRDRGTVRVVVYDALGAHVATLVNRQQTPGLHEVRWEGTNDKGQAVTSGVYFVRLESRGSTLAAAKVSLLK